MVVSDDFFLGPPSLGLPTISSLLPSRGQPSGTSHGGCQSGGSEVLGDQGAPAVWYNNVQYVYSIAWEEKNQNACTGAV